MGFPRGLSQRRGHASFAARRSHGDDRLAPFIAAPEAPGATSRSGLVHAAPVRRRCCSPVSGTVEGGPCRWRGDPYEVIAAWKTIDDRRQFQAMRRLLLVNQADLKGCCW